jgi:hypothetical protein
VFHDLYIATVPLVSSARRAGAAVTVLPAGHASLLCHRSVLFLEPVTQSLRSLHMLVHTSHDATLFARSERLALEAVDAVIEALLNEV